MRIEAILLLTLLVRFSASESCAENTCHGRGRCYEVGEDKTLCVCDSAYTGEQCQYEKIECRENSCVKGVCINDHCVCDVGYAGPYCDYTDRCRDNPCRDHGKCLSTRDGFQCLCDKGYTSSNCEDDIDECSQNPDICQNGGVCQNTDGSFQCQCPSGYDGQLCGYDIDECEPNPCLNGGRCIDGVSDFRCECPTSFSGKRCEVEASDCGCEHGTCSDDPNVSCICDLGWMGYKCTEKITSCEYNPCQNGTHPTQVSLCKEYIMHREPKIHCICGAGLTGDYCDQAYNLCDKNPCRGQGDCTPGPGGTYTCACYDGFTADNCETDIDECKRDAPCKNNGVCTNMLGTYHCDCREGYGGMNCEIDIDECAREPCLNKGTCIDGENSYTCQCQAGFTGHDCEEEINECENNNCPGYSVCVDKINHFKCICNQGAEGRPGCEIDENECTANLCKNGGTCVDLPGDFECQCMEGYSGKTCQFDNTACGVKPCGAHGTCIIQGQDITKFYCICDDGYTGGDCSIDIDECHSNPCQNGAQCIDQPNNFFCDCPPEFTGKTCSLDAQHCANNPCANGGTCTTASTFPFYTCNCEPGYTGDRCLEERLCEENKCNNGGKCILLDNENWRCECAVGYAGATCTTKLAVCGRLTCHNGGTCVSPNDCQCGPGWTGPECRDRASSCADSPCRNGATCRNSFKGLFECICETGFEGQFCESVDSSPCASTPCQNGGRCTQTDQGFHCECQTGFTGRTCSEKDLCAPNPCQKGYVCENFPPDDPSRYMCCEETRAICYRSDGCQDFCDQVKEDGICQAECYNNDCQVDVVDCSTQASLDTMVEDPWKSCPNAGCRAKINNGICDWSCSGAECNYDGMDCMEQPRHACEYDDYCRVYYNNGFCDQGCNNTACHWDGIDCLTDVSYKIKTGIRMTVEVSCEQVTSLKSRLTHTLDIWSEAVSVIDSITPNEDGCDLVISFDNRYCGEDCRTSDLSFLKNYIWANLESSGDGPAFPFRVSAITDANSRSKNTNGPEQISNAIIITIAVIGILLLIAGVMVGRNVIRARARLWEPDGFKTTRKRNIKDISTMGDPVHLKSMPKLSDQHNFNYYMPEQTRLMEVDLEPMYIMGGQQRIHEEDDTTPMITQAAYEFRQRDETASPTTQAEEQIAIGRPASVRPGVGRGETTLHAVCRNKKVDELRRILASGDVDVNVVDAMDRTPLYAAVGSDAVEIVHILLEVDGIDLEKPIKHQGATPLILATKMVYNSIVEKLLKAGALVNAADSSGRTALHWAAAVSNTQAMELLIQYRANKDAESHKKETPLFLAAREGKIEPVKILVCHDAQRHLADSMDQRPIDVARDHLHHDIEDVLQTWNVGGGPAIKQHPVVQQHPGSLTPPQSDDAATASPNSMPTLSPCTKDHIPDRDEKKNSKRKKKKTEAQSLTPGAMYQSGYWAKNQLHSPPNWMSTQMLSPESLQGSPTSSSVPTSSEPKSSGEAQPRLSHYPIHGYPLDTTANYIPHDQPLSHRPNNRPYHQLEYHSSPDSPEEWPLTTSPPNSDWSHTSP